MTIGTILLLLAGILILLGAGQRVLDRMRLTDRQALLFIALIVAGGFLPDIRVTRDFAFNLGGALIPLAICIYLFFKADTTAERVRSVIAPILTAVAVYLLGRLLPDEPEAMPVDPNYIYGPAAGVIAYLFGRSRRGAFIAGVLGAVLADIWSAATIWMQGVPQPLYLGGAGAMDVIVISGLTAVLLAEFMGELLERMTRGRTPDKDREFEDGEFVERRRAK